MAGHRKTKQSEIPHLEVLTRKGLGWRWGGVLNGIISIPMAMKEKTTEGAWGFS